MVGHNGRDRVARIVPRLLTKSIIHKYSIILTAFIFTCILIGSRNYLGFGLRVLRSNQSTVNNNSSIISKNSSFDKIHHYVFRPNVGYFPNVNGHDLDRVLKQLKPQGHSAVSELLHSLHMFGKDLSVPVHDVHSDALTVNSQVKVLDVLLDARRGSHYFDGASTLVPTRYGVRVPLYDYGHLGTSQAVAESHPGQFLSVLASLGIPLTYPMRLDDGTISSVKAIRNDIVANFSLEGEIEWTSIALAIYVDPPSWENKFGQTFNFDILAQELMSRSPKGAACGGTHALIALTIMLKVNDVKTIISPNVCNAARLYLKDKVNRISATQRRDGSWGLDWYSMHTTWKSDESPPNETPLIVTGHILEWTMILPTYLQPSREVVFKGLKWALQATAARQDETTWIQKNYCPVVHATRAVKMLTSPN